MVKRILKSSAMSFSLELKVGFGTAYDPSLIKVVAAELPRRKFNTF